MKEGVGATKEHIIVQGDSKVKARLEQAVEKQTSEDD